MKKIQECIYIIGGILLLIGASLFITGWEMSPYVYLAGSFMFGSMQMADRYKGENFVLKRLRRQQILGAILLVVTGILMLCTQHNEWIACLLVACVFELYTAFRIPQELRKEEK